VGQLQSEVGEQIPAISFNADGGYDKAAFDEL